jgi:hypothetical protein
MSFAKNLIYLESSLSGEILTYKIMQAFDMGLFVGPNVMSIIKLDSINIGYRNLQINDIEMPIKSIVDVLSDNYPSFKVDYAEYLKRKKRNKRLGLHDEGFCTGSFNNITGSVDIWTLKFVGDSLVSRSVYSEFDGSTKYY